MSIRCGDKTIYPNRPKSRIPFALLPIYLALIGAGIWAAARQTLPYCDMNLVHLRDFFGHHNPQGNHFFADSSKDILVQSLDHKPVPYRNPDPQSDDFKGYFPERQQRTDAPPRKLPAVDSNEYHHS